MNLQPSACKAGTLFTEPQLHRYHLLYYTEPHRGALGILLVQVKGQDFFSILPECRTWNNGLRLHEARFWLDIRKNILTVRAVRQWNQLPGEVMGSPTLEAFKRQLDSHLSGML